MITYKPQRIEEFLGNYQTKELIKKFSETKEALPTNGFILHGESGSGKSVLADIFANLLTNNIYKFDATFPVDEISINKMYDQTNSVIIIENSEYLDDRSIRTISTILDYSTTRYIIFTAINLEKVSENLITRCILLKLDFPDEFEIKDIVSSYISEDGFFVDDDKLNEIILSSHGNIRDVLTKINMVMFSSSDFVIDSSVTTRVFYELCMNIYSDPKKAISMAYEVSEKYSSEYCYKKWLEVVINTWRVMNRQDANLNEYDKKYVYEMATLYKSAERVMEQITYITSKNTICSREMFVADILINCNKYNKNQVLQKEKIGTTGKMKQLSKPISVKEIANLAKDKIIAEDRVIRSARENVIDFDLLKEMFNGGLDG